MFKRFKRLIVITVLLAACAGLADTASPVSGSTTCPSSGTKRLASASTPVAGLTVFAGSSNSAIINIGGSSISTTTGIPLSAGDAFSYPPQSNSSAYNLYNVWIICGSASDVLQWMYY